MKNNTIKLLAFSLVIAALSACGGGDDSAPQPPASGPLTKYEGIWNSGCDSHNRETTGATASNTGATLALTIKDEYFDKADCTGAVVATGTFGPPQPPIALIYKETVANASVKLLTGQTIQATVDRISATGSGATITYTGSGVTGPFTVNGEKTWRIAYSGGSTNVTYDLTGTNEGALLLLNNELLTLTPIGNSTTSYAVESRRVR